jgi:hypothetical protein
MKQINMFDNPSGNGNPSMKTLKPSRVLNSHGIKYALSAIGFLVLASTCAFATSKDGIFPSADQVGGQVYLDPLKVGTRFPTDFPVFDLSGKPVEIGKLIAGKKTAVAFFITAAPASVADLKILQDFARVNAPGVQVLGLNADTVGAALESGKPLEATVRTLRIYEKEKQLKNLYVAPNDALDPNGLSNRLGFRGLPTVFIVKADGTIENVFVGPQNWKKGDI